MSKEIYEFDEFPKSVFPIQKQQINVSELDNELRKERKRITEIIENAKVNVYSCNTETVFITFKRNKTELDFDVKRKISSELASRFKTIYFCDEINQDKSKLASFGNDSFIWLEIVLVE